MKTITVNNIDFNVKPIPFHLVSGLNEKQLLKTIVENDLLLNLIGEFGVIKALNETINERQLKLLFNNENENFELIIELKAFNFGYSIQAYKQALVH